jgi:hypothetical protein
MRIVILGSGSISEAEFRKILTNQALDCVYVNEINEINEIKDQIKEYSLNIDCKMYELETKSYSRFRNYKESYNSKHLHRQFRR